jgi:glycosyltransferase involved in cell wall biosynthesis
METHVRDLAIHQTRGDDIDPTVITTTSGNQSDDLSFPVRRARRIGSIGKAAIAPTLPFHVFRSDPDLIHVHVPFHGGLESGFLCSTLLDIPMVATIHMYGWDPSFLHTTYRKGIQNPILRRCDAIVGSTKDYLSQFSFFDDLSETVTTIPHGVDVDRFAPVEEERCQQFRAEYDVPADASVVLFVGSLDEGHYYKRLDWLMEAMSSVLETNPTAHLLVVGTGDRLPTFETLAEELGIDESVTFAGFVPDVDLPVAYTTSDVFVLPSEPDLSESFGIVQLEAMACGTPVIATDTPGPRTVAGDCGDVFKPGAPDQLSEQILRVLEGDETDSPREIATKQYSWETVSAAWRELYRDQLNQ